MELGQATARKPGASSRPPSGWPAPAASQGCHSRKLGSRLDLTQALCHGMQAPRRSAVRPGHAPPCRIRQHLYQTRGSLICTLLLFLFLGVCLTAGSEYARVFVFYNVRSSRNSEEKEGKEAKCPMTGKLWHSVIYNYMMFSKIICR